ncbi:MAG: flagellar basal body-associated protein FliL [Colwellia sp.]
MNTVKRALGILCLSLLFSSPTKAESTYAYLGLEPDIVTNFITTKKRMGYVRLSVELMIEDANTYEIIEHHAPLLRDAIIDIIGQQPEEKIKSIKGRAEIKKLCEEKVKALLITETGQPLIRKILFTQWLDN